MEYLSPEDRYLRDPEFCALVKMLYDFIARNRYTPTELREAVIMAATQYELRSTRSYLAHMNTKGQWHQGSRESCLDCYFNKKFFEEGK